MIVCARHIHIALSDGDECGDDAISIPRKDVPALIEALRTVTAEVPKCGECDKPATQYHQWREHQGRHPFCDEHGVTVTPIESVTEVTI